MFRIEKSMQNVIYFLLESGIARLSKINVDTEPIGDKYVQRLDDDDYI